jgi:hypothetical protein
VKSEVPTAITVMITDLLDVASCVLVDTYQSLVGMFFLRVYCMFSVLSRGGREHAIRPTKALHVTSHKPLCVDSDYFC